MSFKQISSCFALLALFATLAFGHSQMRCAKYDVVTGVCSAPIRNEGESFTEEAHLISSGGVCQKPMSNPISASYGNGAACGYAPCPLPMGTFQQGENFTVMWLARNHAVQDQTPGVIQLFLSPVETMTQGNDYAGIYDGTPFCTAPFISCNGQNGNFVQCTASCIMPTNAETGIHTLAWRWFWPNHDNNPIYTTCADIYVTARSTGGSPSVPVPPTQPATPTAPVTTATATTAAAPATTGSVRPATTGAATPVTTGSVRPATTGANVPVTTGTVRPATTGTAAPVTTGAATQPTQPATPSSGAAQPTNECTLGQMRCTGTGSTQYQSCNQANKWAPAQSCQTGLKCNPSGNVIYCY